jgi:hypothetical protein
MIPGSSVSSFPTPPISASPGIALTTRHTSSYPYIEGASDFRPRRAAAESASTSKA